MNNVVCVNWGTKYSEDYTHRLFNMVKRNTDRVFNFYVLTDQVDRYNKYSHYITIELNTDEVGWWNKLQMYRKGVLPDGEFLYFDLDVVIVDNIDCFFDHPSFGITRDFIRPDNGLLPGKEFNSSVLRFNSRQSEGIYQHYINNRKMWHNYQKQIHFFGDQNVTSHYVNYYPDFLNVFPDEWLWSYKKGVARGKHAGDRSQMFGRWIPKGGRVCIFHGSPNPEEVRNEVEWVNQYYI
ncbi:MAG: hypothetical protein CMK23_06530 [Porticoccaceae bacterium]|nr:hypothetical protein [Porticoccaceae bacterium]